MPNALDQRLASLWHRDRIDLHADVEKITDDLNALFQSMYRHLIALATDPPRALDAAVDQALEQSFAAAISHVHRRFRQIANAAHARATHGFAVAVPRKWFRVLGFFWERIGEAEEPARKSMSEEEWEEKLAAYVFPPPDEESVSRWLDHKGPGGLSWDERLRSWEGQTRAAIRSELQQGISAGEGLRPLRARLRPLVDDATWKAQRIARTEGRRVGELAQQRAVQQAGNLIAAQQIVATLDERTRPEHAMRHGKQYDRRDDGSFIAADGEHLPDLPDAPNCRCFASPVLSTPREFIKDPALGADFVNATADTIPDPAAYHDWFAAAEEPQRRAAVGSQRYRIVQARLEEDPEWEDFLELDGKLVSAKKLRRETVAQREARKAAVKRVIAQRQALLAQIATGKTD